MSSFKLDPNADAADLPKRSQLPKIDGAPVGAAWFWGEEDEVCLDIKCHNTL